jgi:hypothetical protein
MAAIFLTTQPAYLLKIYHDTKFQDYTEWLFSYHKSAQLPSQEVKKHYDKKVCYCMMFILGFTRSGRLMFTVPTLFFYNIIYML